MGSNVLCNRLSNYHPNIKFTIEENPCKFLDTKLTKINDFYKLPEKYEIIITMDPHNFKTL